MTSAGLRHAGTLKNQGRTHSASIEAQTSSPTGADEEFTGGFAGREEDETYFGLHVLNQGQY